MNNTLEITGLSKSFPNFQLNNINFTLPEGYIMGFIGPNGAGKTSIIKLILNMLKKDSGMIKVFGLDHILGEEEIKENIGVVFEQSYYLEKWTLKELEKAIRIFYSTWDSGKYYGYLKDFGLDKNQTVKSLSKGMKMKLMIAVALSHDTKLLILDEPTSGLDAVSREELLDILRNYIIDERKSVLLSSHLTSDLEKIADFITFVHNGEVVYTGTKDDLLEQYCIVKGDSKDLTVELRSGIIGLTESAVGFEGLLPVADMRSLSNKMVTDVATLDDIILFTDRKRKQR